MGLVMDAHWDKMISVGVIKPTDNMWHRLCSSHSEGEYPDTDSKSQRPKGGHNRSKTEQLTRKVTQTQDVFQDKTWWRKDKLGRKCLHFFCSAVMIRPNLKKKNLSFVKGKLFNFSQNEENSKGALLTMNETGKCMRKKGIIKMREWERRMLQRARNIPQWNAKLLLWIKDNQHKWHTSAGLCTGCHFCEV